MRISGNLDRDHHSFGTKDDAGRRASRVPVAAVFSALATVLMAPAADAVDGVLEINQTCAVQTGCFGGDTAAGYPVTIITAGSYRLTTNLIVPNENTSGIVVSTSDVGIDLNNFAIIRSGCEGATTNCTPAPGTGSGVEITSLANRGLSVKSGSITGMGNCGVLLGEQTEVSGLRVRWNSFAGIGAGAGSTVSGNTAFQNADDGINAGDGSTVSGNTVYSNGGNGIRTQGGSTVQRNTVSANGAYGLLLVSPAAYGENVITNNTVGTVNGGVNLGSNSCNGTTTCP